LQQWIGYGLALVEEEKMEFNLPASVQANHLIPQAGEEEEEEEGALSSHIP